MYMYTLLSFIPRPPRSIPYITHGAGRPGNETIYMYMYYADVEFTCTKLLHS